jgi:hypothetical protein
MWFVTSRLLACNCSGNDIPSRYTELYESAASHIAVQLDLNCAIRESLGSLCLSVEIE